MLSTEPLPHKYFLEGSFFFLPHDGKGQCKTEIWGREEGRTIRERAKIKMDMKTKHLEGLQ